MDSLYLQQALQLPDCTDIMHSGDHGTYTVHRKIIEYTSVIVTACKMLTLK